MSASKWCLTLFFASYDAKAITYLQDFGTEDADHFFDVLKEFVGFSGSWAQLTKDLLQSDRHSLA